MNEQETKRALELGRRFAASVRRDGESLVTRTEYRERYGCSPFDDAAELLRLTAPPAEKTEGAVVVYDQSFDPYPYRLKIGTYCIKSSSDRPTLDKDAEIINAAIAAAVEAAIAQVHEERNAQAEAQTAWANQREAEIERLNRAYKALRDHQQQPAAPSVQPQGDDAPEKVTESDCLHWDKPMTSRQAARCLMTRGFVALELFRAECKRQREAGRREGQAVELPKGYGIACGRSSGKYYGVANVEWRPNFAKRLSFAAALADVKQHAGKGGVK